MYILQAQGVSFTYQSKYEKKLILDNCSLNLQAGHFYALVGESGSGKTTFLSLLGGLERPTKGKILFKGRSIAKMKMTDYLKKEVSFVFQEYNLIMYMTALENVLLAMSVHEGRARVDKAKAIDSLKAVGLSEDKIKRKVNTLSGGERQRVAIARAIACDTPIILADEPTGNLDEVTTKGIIALFKELAHCYQKCVVVVTHSKEVASNADEAVILDPAIKRFKILNEPS